MPSKLSIAVMLVCCAWCAPIHAQDATWLVSGFISGGGAYDGPFEPAGGFGFAVEREMMPWAVRVSAETLRIGRSCKTSDPPICGIDTPGGEVFTLGIARTLAHAESFDVMIRPEIGVGRWIDNAERDRYVRAVAGLGGELKVHFGTGSFILGARVLASDPVVFTVGTAGLGIRF